MNTGYGSNNFLGDQPDLFLADQLLEINSTTPNRNRRHYRPAAYRTNGNYQLTLEEAMVRSQLMQLD